jgi:hypothetical protein
LLLDRIYSIKYDYQIFGSQIGVPIAPKNILREVKDNYKWDEIINQSDSSKPKTSTNDWLRDKTKN